MIQLDRILMAIDFSPVSEAAATFALLLAKKRQAAVNLIAVETTDDDLAEEVLEAEDALSELADRLQRKYLQVRPASEGFPEDLPVAHQTVSDRSPANGIVEFAETHGVDLIVAGTRGRRGVSRAILGSVAADILRSAPCPVLTVRAPKGEIPDEVNKVVVPVDFSPLSKGAVWYGAGIAQLFDAELTITHVMEKAGDSSAYGFKPSVFGTAEAYKRVQRDLSKLTEGLPIDATLQVLDGPPAKAISDYATEKQVDLLIMPTRGQSGVKRLWVGSVAESVITTAPCPVIASTDFIPYLMELPEATDEAKV